MLTREQWFGANDRSPFLTPNAKSRGRRAPGLKSGRLRDRGRRKLQGGRYEGDVVQPRVNRRALGAETDLDGQHAFRIQRRLRQTEAILNEALKTALVRGPSRLERCDGAVEMIAAAFSCSCATKAVLGRGTRRDDEQASRALGTGLHLGAEGDAAVARHVVQLPLPRCILQIGADAGAPGLETLTYDVSRGRGVAGCQRNRKRVLLAGFVVEIVPTATAPFERQDRGVAIVEIIDERRRSQLRLPPGAPRIVGAAEAGLLSRGVEARSSVALPPVPATAPPPTAGLSPAPAPRPAAPPSSLAPPLAEPSAPPPPCEPLLRVSLSSASS